MVVHLHSCLILLLAGSELSALRPAALLVDKEAAVSFNNRMCGLRDLQTLPRIDPWFSGPLSRGLLALLAEISQLLPVLDKTAPSDCLLLIVTSFAMFHSSFVVKNFYATNELSCLYIQNIPVCIMHSQLIEIAVFDSYPHRLTVFPYDVTITWKHTRVITLVENSSHESDKESSCLTSN